MLSDAEIGSFVADGFVAVRGAVPAGVVRACQDETWAALSEHGVQRDDPGTWRDPVVRIACPDSAAFTAAGSQPALWEAFDQLIGAGRWLRRRGVGGTIPVRFPSLGDPGDAGWPVQLATGQAGDVFLCHPFLVHAASWPHTGASPRIMAQPGVALHGAFPLTSPLSPVERGITGE